MCAVCASQRAPLALLSAHGQPVTTYSASYTISRAAAALLAADVKRTRRHRQHSRARPRAQQHLRARFHAHQRCTQPGQIPTARLLAVEPVECMAQRTRASTRHQLLHLLSAQVRAPRKRDVARRTPIRAARDVRRGSTCGHRRRRQQAEKSKPQRRRLRTQHQRKLQLLGRAQREEVSARCTDAGSPRRWRRSRHSRQQRG